MPGGGTEADMTGRETELVTLVNETTATGGTYEVSHAVAGMLRGMGEDELSEGMPKPTPQSLGYEHAAYATGLVGIARAHGVADRDISVRERDIPTFFFDTGWGEASGMPPVDDADGTLQQDVREEPPVDHAGDDGSPLVPVMRRPFAPEFEVKSSLCDMFCGRSVAQEDIRFMLEHSDARDAQYEKGEDGRQRLVRIRSAYGYEVAIAPTWETCDGPVDEIEYEQPYEVVRELTMRAIETARWRRRESDLEPSADARKSETVRAVGSYGQDTTGDVAAAFPAYAELELRDGGTQAVLPHEEGDEEEGAVETIRLDSEDALIGTLSRVMPQGVVVTGLTPDCETGGLLAKARLVTGNRRIEGDAPTALYALLLARGDGDLPDMLRIVRRIVTGSPEARVNGRHSIKEALAPKE